MTPVLTITELRRPARTSDRRPARGQVPQHKESGITLAVPQK